MEIERPFMSYFSLQKNPFDIFESIDYDDLIVDDDEAECDTSTTIHDEDQVIKNEKQSVGERPIRGTIKKTVQVAPSKKQSNCNEKQSVGERPIRVATVQVALSKKQSNCNGITGTTAEHGNAVCSQEMSSENSNKRKRPAYKAPRKSIADQYKNLMENWNPPSLQSYNFGLHDDDQLWLFQRKPKQARVDEKNIGSSNGTISGSSSALCPPWAQYLPDVDLYALPYTVPF